MSILQTLSSPRSLSKFCNEINLFVFPSFFYLLVNFTTQFATTNLSNQIFKFSSIIFNYELKTYLSQGDTLSSGTDSTILKLLTIFIYLLFSSLWKTLSILIFQLCKFAFCNSIFLPVHVRVLQRQCSLLEVRQQVTSQRHSAACGREFWWGTWDH